MTETKMICNRPCTHLKTSYKEKIPTLATENWENKEVKTRGVAKNGGD